MQLNLNQFFTKKHLAYAIIFLISLVIRIIYGYHSWYIRDQARVFDLGFKLYHDNIIPIHGSPIVYVDSVLPGSLQGILSAIPLYFSQGHPFGIIIFVQLLNLISCIILAFIYFNIFKNINKIVIFSLIVFSPMNIIYSYGWNPSFMIIFTSLFILGLYKVFNDKKSFIGNFLLYFPLLFLLQLNLQFIIFPAILVILLFKKLIKFPSVKVIITSFLPGFIFLLPFIVNKLSAHSQTSNNWNLHGNFFDSININIENIFSYFHILLRFLSFSSGEITRNINKEYLFNNYHLLPYFIISIIISVIIILVGLFFFLNKKNWEIFKKKEAQFNFYDKFNFTIIIIPFITAILFVFSITPMSTHKIWSLFPFSFYPLFFMLEKYKSTGYLFKENEFVFFNFFTKKIDKIKVLLNYLQKTSIIYIYLACTLLYGCICASQIPINFSYVMEKSRSFCTKENSKYINDVITNEKNALKEEDYTFSLLCQYWESLK